jgi:Endonuclease/Exonuclease/phosphatase family
VRIISWNMAANTTSRSAEVHSAGWGKLLALSPDVALVQEAMAPPPTIDMGLVACIVPERRWSSLVYSPDPIDEPRVLEELSDHGRVAMGQINVGERTIALVSLHAWTEPATVPHLEAIFARLAETLDCPCIVAGDFNSCRLADEVWPGYGHLEFFERIEDDFVNCHWHLIRPRLGPSGAERTGIPSRTTTSSSRRIWRLPCVRAGCSTTSRFGGSATTRRSRRSWSSDS